MRAAALAVAIAVAAGACSSADGDALAPEEPPAAPTSTMEQSETDEERLARYLAEADAFWAETEAEVDCFLWPSEFLAMADVITSAPELRFGPQVALARDPAVGAPSIRRSVLLDAPSLLLDRVEIASAEIETALIESSRTRGFDGSPVWGLFDFDIDVLDGRPVVMTSIAAGPDDSATVLATGFLVRSPDGSTSVGPSACGSVGVALDAIAERVGFADGVALAEAWVRATAAGDGRRFTAAEAAYIDEVLG